MLIQTEKRGAGVASVKVDHNMSEKVQNVKLTAAKCYIKEMNNNMNSKDDRNVTWTEDTLELGDSDEHKVTPRDTEVRQPMMSRPVEEFGFSNPFQPGGCVNEDADMIIRMWKEKRLAEIFCPTTVTTEEDEKDGETFADNKNTDNNNTIVGFGKTEDVRDKTNTELILSKKKKFQPPCCSVM